MKLQEEKAAEVRERWLQVQEEKAKDKMKDNLRAAVKSLRGESAKPRQDRPLLTESAGSMAKKVMDIADGKKEMTPMTPEEKAALAKRNMEREHSEALKDLKEIEWFGKVAVGESISFPGWWSVVPPVGCKISYGGDHAQEQARAQAKMIREWYE